MVKKSRHNLITAVIVIIMAVLVFGGLFMLQRSYDAVESFAYGVSDNDVMPQSIEPCNRGGVSRSGDIVITWSGIVSSELADYAEITPAARGEWRVSGNKLIFTPQKLSPGTFYTVYIPEGTVIRGDNSLKKDLTFSFETADDSLRYNETDGISVAARSFYFNSSDDVSIPVTATDGISGIQAELFRCEDKDNYLRALNKMLSLPEWAELSYAGISADTSDFTLISREEAVIENGTLNLSSLGCGLYLLRLSSDKISRDVAVSVGNIDIGCRLEGENIVCTTTEDRANSLVAFNGREQAVDSAGNFVFDFTCTEREFCASPSLKAVIVSCDEGDSALFLNREELFHNFEGNLFADRSVYRPGEEINLWGMLVNGFNYGVGDKVRLQLSSVSGCVKKANVNAEEGVFSYCIDAPLSKGTYKISLIYDNSVLDTVSFSVGSDSPKALFDSSEAASQCIDDGIWQPVLYQDTPGNSSVPAIDCNDAINVYNGNTVPVYASLGGSYTGIAMVSLCKGYLPDGVSGQCFYGEYIKSNGWGQPLENYVLFNTAEIWCELDRNDLQGEYFIRIACYTPGKTTVSRYIPVSIHNGCCLKAEDIYFGVPDCENSIKFTLESDSYAKYSVTLNDEIYHGSGKGECLQRLKPLAVGEYKGEIIAYSGSNILSRHEFSLVIQPDSPVAAEINEKEGFAAFKVNPDFYDEARFMLNQAAAPGDQIFTRMERQLLSFLDEGGLFKGDVRGLSDLQNADGGFGRYDNGESDLLLTSIVASCGGEMLYDRNCAASYLRYRLSNADNQEDAALACWGLAALGKNVTDSLRKLEKDSNMTDRGTLYLLQSYLALGDIKKAGELYGEIKDCCEDDGSEETAYLKSLLLEASVNLNLDETDILVNDLLDASVTNQTSRFLFFHVLSHIMEPGDISRTADESLNDGIRLLYLNDISAGLETGADCVFSDGGSEVSKANRGDCISMSVSWKAENNHLYAVCLSKNPDIQFLTSSRGGLRDAGNCYVDYVIGDNADITFIANGYRVAAPSVYVFDMTAHEWIGMADTSGWEVQP